MFDSSENGLAQKQNGSNTFYVNILLGQISSFIATKL